MLTSLLRNTSAAVIGLAIFQGSVAPATAAPPTSPGSRPGGMTGTGMPSTPHHPGGFPFRRLTPSFATYWPNGYPYWAYRGYGWPGYGDGWPGYASTTYYTELANAQAQQATAVILQARLQQALLNQRRALESAARTPKPAPDVNEQLADVRLKLAQSAPPLAEIRSAKALNELLADLQKHAGTNAAALDVPLDAKVLAKISVTSGPGRDSARFSFLQAERTRWPEFLQGSAFKAERATLSRLSAESIAAVQSGSPVSPELRRTLEALYERLEGIQPAAGGEGERQWMEARAFVRRYSTAARALEQPDAREYLNGEFSPRGSTVAELVDHMTKNALRFAADAGDNGDAYRKLHRALADSSLAVQAGRLAAK